MTIIRRRTILALGGAALLGSGARARAETVLRVGDQIAGNRSVMEAAGVLADVPYQIRWSQFPAAAPLLEALNAGALDVGFTGDVPFLFVYASGVPVRVIGVVRGGAKSQAILVPRGSPIKTLADLKGRKLAVNKGGNGHYLALALLDHAGIDPTTVNIVTMPPPDARLALAGGAVDAWSVWDPYVSIAIADDGARVLVDATGVYGNKSFDLAHLDAIASKRAMLEDFERRLARARRWALSHVEENAAQVSALTRIPAPLIAQSLRNRAATPIAIDDQVIAETQSEADLFTRYHVLPAHIDVSGAFDRGFAGALTVSQ
ncbi:MAG: ABC transporter substrate-binding protein [Alphaproteobacteria bacterium]|nr:ABC transporter substrate-binding protein [Alphaproteobacteria bacterium]